MHDPHCDQAFSIDLSATAVKGLVGQEVTRDDERVVLYKYIHFFIDKIRN